MVFAPTPRDYSFKMNKKEKRIALKSAFTSRVQDNKFIVLDELKMEEIKTRKFKEVLDAFKVKKAMVILDSVDMNVILSARNLPDVKTFQINTINTYEIMKYSTVIATKQAVQMLEEVYA